MSTAPTSFPQSLTRTSLLDQNGAVVWPWLKWFQTLGGSILPLSPVPTAHNSAGTFGQVALDANFAYFCIAPNIWKRVAISTW